ncbi:hypothetical protein HPB51_027015 [Rhipicephalus microplus]|uniref:Uncharacterized protein n=1 Tax=Rhipicephalus microplus TaxID=6941 RepID=A0A9J6D0Y7_RHIMP|nr:hypothetical protein HPB51_027015 [Rhipicephalus microplus]
MECAVDLYLDGDQYVSCPNDRSVPEVWTSFTKADYRAMSWGRMSVDIFLEAVQRSCHTNTFLSKTEKFCYFHNYLVDEAIVVIAGSPKTQASYESAAWLLKQRLWNKSSIVQQHF